MHLQYSYYEKIICKICLTKHTRHGGYVIIYTCRHLLYIKGGRLKRYHRAQSGAACIQFDFAIGAMIGVGSAIRYVVEKNKGDTSGESYFFHALLWCIMISVIFILIGIFIPDKLVGLLGGDSAIINTGKNYTRIFMLFTPFFMCNYVCNAFVRNDGAPSIAMCATLFSSLFNIVLITYSCSRLDLVWREPL